MKRKRLDHLATFLLEQVPSSHFDLGSWRRGLHIQDEDLKAHRCGTMACAIGWACVMPSFIKEGFRVDVDTGSPTYVHEGRTYSSWNAVELFFGLDGHEALALFSGDSYLAQRGPKDVATRIWAFMADKEPVMRDAQSATQINMDMANQDDEPDEPDDS